MTRQTRAGSRSRAASGEALLGVGTVTASALSYVFVLVLSRALGPADFGGFSALNSIGLVLAVPASAFQVVYASRVARKGAAAFDLRLPLLVGSAVCLATLALSPFLAHLTRVDTVLAPVLVALGTPSLIVNGALMGGLLGLRRTSTLALAYVVMGFGRVGAAGLAFALDLGLVGALALVSGAGVAMTGVLWWMARGEVHLPWSAPRHVRRVLRALVRSNSSTGVLMALTSVDVVLARYVLPRVDSGEYALVSTLGRSPLWVTQFLALALVPTLAASGSRRSILRAAGLVLAVCLLGTGVAAVSPDLWVGLLGGSEYRGASDLLLPYLLLGTLLALAQVLIVAELAQGRHLLAKVAWLAVGLEVLVVLTLARDSGSEVLGVATAAAALVVVVGFVEVLREPPRRRATPADAPQGPAVLPSPADPLVGDAAPLAPTPRGPEAR